MTRPPSAWGLALNLRNEKGQLVSAGTRGDSVTGEDVTESAVLVPSIAHQFFRSDHLPGNRERIEAGCGILLCLSGEGSFQLSGCAGIVCRPPAP